MWPSIRTMILCAMWWLGLTDSVTAPPCGNGTCARSGLLHAQGRFKAGDSFEQRSVIDSAFLCKCLEEVTVGGKPAIIPQISGCAWVTAYSTYVMDESDPFGQGFSLTH